MFDDNSFKGKNKVIGVVGEPIEAGEVFYITLQGDGTITSDKLIIDPDFTVEDFFGLAAGAPVER